MTPFAGDSSGSPRGGLTAVSVEPPGAVARRRLVAVAGYEPLRTRKAIGSGLRGLTRLGDTPLDLLAECRGKALDS